MAAADGMVRAKFGWTERRPVRRSGHSRRELRTGDPNLAHKRDERVALAQITAVTGTRRRYLTG